MQLSVLHVPRKKVSHSPSSACTTLIAKLSRILKKPYTIKQQKSFLIKSIGGSREEHIEKMKTHIINRQSYYMGRIKLSTKRF